MNIQMAPNSKNPRSAFTSPRLPTMTPATGVKNPARISMMPNMLNDVSRCSSSASSIRMSCQPISLILLKAQTICASANIQKLCAKKLSRADPGQLIRPNRTVVLLLPILSTITPANSAKIVPMMKFREIKNPI